MQGLQQRKVNASTEAANLSVRNQELCQELTEIDQLAQQLEKDKELVLETADMELQDAKVTSWGHGVKERRKRVIFIIFRVNRL